MTNFRPVPLTEHAVFQGAAYRKVPPNGQRAPCASAARPVYSPGPTARCVTHGLVTLHGIAARCAAC
jgi:hypothetical protein